MPKPKLVEISVNLGSDKPMTFKVTEAEAAEFIELQAVIKAGGEPSAAGASKFMKRVSDTAHRRVKKAGRDVRASKAQLKDLTIELITEIVAQSFDERVGKTVKAALVKSTRGWKPPEKWELPSILLPRAGEDSDGE